MGDSAGQVGIGDLFLRGELTEEIMMNSMEPDAENNCERFVTEALLAVPGSAEALQTLASVRISQTRMDDAKAALERSVGLWKDLEPGSFIWAPVVSLRCADWGGIV